MAQKWIYIVDHYVPFPESEHGGLCVIVAENDDECFEYIKHKDIGHKYAKYYPLLRNNVKHSIAYRLHPDDQVNSCFVDSFITN